MKNLESFGVQELDIKEIGEIDGGILQYLIAAAVSLTVMGIHDSIDHPDAFWRGLTKGL